MDQLVKRWNLRVTGIVQGVGFRPFVYRIAKRHRLTGFVGNDSQGVFIEAEGTERDLADFLSALKEEVPPRALLESVDYSEIPIRGELEFVIVQSQDHPLGQTLISTDIATCPDCTLEIFDPEDRRYGYPFTNCTNCGPRVTIIQSMPYDRKATTMSIFPMCLVCQREYDDPENRRFHAQPNACPVCGPKLELYDGEGKILETENPIASVANFIRNGDIVAVKGIGGVHLACNPFDQEAVERLRIRKHRPDQPLALMVADVNQAKELCHITQEEEALLKDPAAPIVLVNMREDSTVAWNVAPRQKRLGIMLAYTPLHHLLLREVGIPLVMTSGNKSGMPMIHTNEEALKGLQGIADWFLLHDRPIHLRMDDSVAFLYKKEPVLIRRARGYAPMPISLPEACSRTIAGMGGELKTTFSFGQDSKLYVSHYLGDLKTYETLQDYKRSFDHYRKLFRAEPEMIAYDLHPDYLSTRFAQELIEDWGIAGVGVQHHEAHVASCLVDNECSPDRQVIGVAFDGTGYGTDGAIWGGEFFTGSLRKGFTRNASLEYVALPGGDKAVKEPWRSGVSYLINTFGVKLVNELNLELLKHVGEKQVSALHQMISKQVNSPLTSSMGRLFDAVASLLTVTGSSRATYEGQAAIEMEQLVDTSTATSYSFQIDFNQTPWRISAKKLFEQVVEDLQKGEPPAVMAARFHNGVAQMVLSVCVALSESTGITTAVLTGGVFQNKILLEKTVRLLEERKFQVCWHRRIPSNDGGISVGQVVLANYKALQ